MSQADIETLRVVYNALDQGDWPAASRAWHSDAELRAADRMTQAGTYRGLQEIQGFFEDLLEPFEDVDVEPQEFFDRGDQIVVFLLLRSRPKGSSAMMEIRIGHLVTMHAGKVSRLEIFPEREKALEAAGEP
jgi:ketosteroid isomerase-like protein